MRPPPTASPRGHPVDAPEEDERKKWEQGGAQGPRSRQARKVRQGMKSGRPDAPP